MTENSCDVGLAIGGATGENLALSMISSGLSVCMLDGVNTPAAKAQNFARTKAAKGRLSFARDEQSFAAALKSPRVIFAGAKKTAEAASLIKALAENLDRADLLIDCSSTDIAEAQKRFQSYENIHCNFATACFAGDLHGARGTGISALFSGSKTSWEICKDIFEIITASSDNDVSGCARVGDGSAALMAKNMFGALEYANMQLACEAFDCLKIARRMTDTDAVETLSEWNGELRCAMLSAIVKIASFKDASGQNLLEKIRDVPSQRSSGALAILASFSENMPLDTVSAAVFARYVSALKSRRSKLAAIYGQSESARQICLLPTCDDIKRALRASQMITVSQCFSIMRSTSARYAWSINYGECARVWNINTSISSAVLDMAANAYSRNSDLDSLLLDESIRKDFLEDLSGLRKVAAYSALDGLALPCINAAISAFDAARRANSPANLLQALGDLFNLSGFERIDAHQGEIFHSSFSKNL